MRVNHTRSQGSDTEFKSCFTGFCSISKYFLSLKVLAAIVAILGRFVWALNCIGNVKVSNSRYELIWGCVAASSCSPGIEQGWAGWNWRFILNDSLMVQNHLKDASQLGFNLSSRILDLVWQAKFVNWDPHCRPCKHYLDHWRSRWRLNPWWNFQAWAQINYCTGNMLI